MLISQSQIRANFQAINNTWASNHFPLTGNSLFYGMHNVLVLRPQTDPTTSATQVALYNKLVSSVPQMFFRPNINQTPIQMTYSSIKADSSATQYSFVAGPFIVYGGTISNATNPQTVTLSPGTTLLYVGLIMVNPTTTAKAFATSPGTLSGTTFTISYAPQPVGSKINISYFAIGLP